MSKKSTKALASAALMSLVLTTALSAGPVKAAQGEVTRVSGADRYATASQVATANWADGSDNVVLVSGEGYADAVSASALAKKLDAPILLTKSDSLSADAQTALETLKPKNIYVVGGNASISQSIRTELAKSYTLTELGGSNRYETNAAVAEELVKLGVSASDVLVVGGEGFSDALSVAPVAAAKGQILLLANNNSSQPAIDFVKENKSNVTVVGTSNVISDSVYNALGATTRVDGGADRFATNLKVLDNFKDSLKTDKLYIANATAANPDDLYADALVASAVAGKYSAPLVLVDTESSDATTNAIAYIADNGKTSDLQLIGGTGVVSQDTEDAINKAINGDNPDNPDNPNQGSEVQSIEAIGLNQIKVTFNGEVDEDTAEEINNYEVDGDTPENAVASLQDDKKTVLITLAEAQDQSDEVDVTVKEGILSEDSSETIPEFTQSVTFEDTTAPTVESVEVRGSNKLAIKFSEAVKADGDSEKTALQSVVSKLDINDKNLSSFGVNYDVNSDGELKYSSLDDAVKSDDGDYYYTDGVELYFDSALPTGNNTLKVSEGDEDALEDVAGFPIAETTEDFNVDTLESEPQIESIEAPDDGKVYINFDRPMDTKTAEDIDNYEINDDNADITKAELKKDDTQVKLTVSGLNENSNKLYVSDDVEDAYGNSVPDDTYKSFDLETDDTKPEVTSVYALDSDTIRVRFSKDVDVDYATSESNYKLKDGSGNDVTSHIENIDDVSDNVYDINLDDDLTDAEYTITIKNIRDTASDPNVMDDYTTTFEGGDIDPEVTGVYGVTDSDESNEYRKVTLVFNKEMDGSTLNDVDNYQFVDGDDDTEDLPSGADISVSSDNKSVTIEFPDSYGWDDSKDGDHKVAEVYAPGVEDVDGNTLGIGGNGGNVDVNNEGSAVKENTLNISYDGDDLVADITFNNSIDEDTVAESDFQLAGQEPDTVSVDGATVTLRFDEDSKDKIDAIKAAGNGAELTIADNPSTKDVAGGSISIGDAAVTPYSFAAAPKWNSDNTEAEAGSETSKVKVEFDTPIDPGSVRTSDFTFAVKGTTLEANKVTVDGRDVIFEFNNADEVGNDSVGNYFKEGNTITVTPKNLTEEISTPKDENGEYAYYEPSDDDLEGVDVEITAAEDADTTTLEAPKVDSVTSTATAVTGTAKAGAKVEVKNADGTLLGTATAGDDGKYSVKIDAQAAGTKLSVTAADADGNTSEAAAVTVE